jgi:hypothetical protein
VYGTGQCQQDGSYEITWTIDNHGESEPLHITSTQASSPAKFTPSLPGAIGAKQTKSYVQVVDGTKAGVFTLKVTGHWNSDRRDRTNTATVNLYQACDQPQQPPVTPPVVPPVTPPAGGMGGGITETPITPAVTTTVSTPQVVTPVGAVNAGNGGAPKTLSLASIAGLIGSVSALGFGIRGLKKQA